MSFHDAEVTALLADWSDGDSDALERLIPLVVDELRRLAGGLFRRESEAHTLQPTALVNEVYMRLADQRRVSWDNRSQFFAFAALLMRRVLVDHAKARKAAKRGGGAAKIPLSEELALGEVVDLDILALDQALASLAQFDPRQARVVELRFFAGLSHEEIAELLDVSLSTVKRDWRTARLWLYREMSRDLPPDPSTDSLSRGLEKA
jgi:RNA polymerase sigma factor (TIGR02999 family)